MAENSMPEKSSGLVLSLGSINADFQFRVQRRPEISETLTASEFKRFGGGKAANVAYCVRRLGGEAMLFAHTGDDDLAGQALSPLRDIGVDISGVRPVTGTGTGVAAVIVPPDGKKGIVFASNANMDWTGEDAAAVAQAIVGLPDASVLVMDCGIAGHVLEKAAAAAVDSRHLIVLDPSPAECVTETLIAAASVIVPNSVEAEQLTGFECNDASGAQAAGAALLERGAAMACIKMPQGGCVVVEPQQITHIGAVAVDVVDTTGAGDAFAAALAVALVEQRSMVEAATLAVAASHLAVTAYGAQAVALTRTRLQEMANRLDVWTKARSVK